MTPLPESFAVYEGEVEFHVPSAGKSCKTWYKVIGDLKSGFRPLVALHGGPGTGSDYLLILSDITLTRSHPLVVYDQIGCGRSTHLPEKMGDTAFWTEELFLNELDNLLQHLEIKDDYDLCGHSWGGNLASRHAVARPSGLKHLILMSTPADMGLWIEAQNKLRKNLPQEVQDILNKHEKEGSTDSPEYEEASGIFYSKHLCTLNPMPDEVLAGFECLKNDPTVYQTINGPSEFHVVGPLKDWTIVADAHKINVPTLITNGRYDEATDSVCYPFFKEVPCVKWVQFANSSHMAHFEERQRFMKVVGDFLVD